MHNLSGFLDTKLPPGHCCKSEAHAVGSLPEDDGEGLRVGGSEGYLEGDGEGLRVGRGEGGFVGLTVVGGVAVGSGVCSCDGCPTDTGEFGTGLGVCDCDGWITYTGGYVTGDGFGGNVGLLLLLPSPNRWDHIGGVVT